MATERGATDDPFRDVPPADSGSDQPGPGAFQAPPAEDQGFVAGHIRRSRHPYPALVHVGFKALALFVYLFCGWFTSNFVFSFILCLMVLVVDFWAVKNVTGRLLVGLRWWSEVAEDGGNVWRFESLDDRSVIGRADSRLFWGGLIFSLIAWALLALVALLKFNVDWVLIPIVALTLGGANFYGYFRCRRDHRQKLQRMGQLGGTVVRQVGSAMFSSVLTQADDAGESGGGPPPPPASGPAHPAAGPKRGDARSEDV